jgi:23S rRNA pseudouridine1911/1915/1917 synthase
MAGPSRSTRVAAGAEDAGDRLDRFLARRLPMLSRSRIQQLIKSGHVRVSRGVAAPSLEVSAGLVADVDVPPAEPATVEAEALPLDVLYDDGDVVVVNKPAGIVVHPAAGHARGTLVNALLHHVAGLSGVGGRERPGIVHRLDRGTSGVMVVAKHDRAHQSLARQFHAREVGKEYVALVWGTVRDRQVFDKPIGRDPKHRQRMSSRARRARPATTRVLSVEPLGGVSLVRLAPGTGRTHQIRVHLSEAGHPIAGDELYGGVRRRVPPKLSAVSTLERPFLHAARLSFHHPADGRTLTFEAPLPPDLEAVLARLRRQAGAGARA